MPTEQPLLGQRRRRSSAWRRASSRRRLRRCGRRRQRRRCPCRGGGRSRSAPVPGSSISPSISLDLRTSSVRVRRTASSRSGKPSASMRPISRLGGDARLQVDSQSRPGPSVNLGQNFQFVNILVIMSAPLAGISITIIHRKGKHILRKACGNK